MRIPLSWLIGLVLLGTCYVPDHVSAGRIIFNPQQKSQLQQVKTIFIKTLTLTEKGLVDPTVIEKAASDRLTATGFTVIATESEPHDVMLKVKCDERKPWGGVRKSDGEIQQPGAPSRNWKGPACQLTYVFDGRKGLGSMRYGPLSTMRGRQLEPTGTAIQANSRCSTSARRCGKVPSRLILRRNGNKPSCSLPF